ncbi:MAG: ubiquitin-like domain-containing protein [Nocardioidaceae bacterium]
MRTTVTQLSKRHKVLATAVLAVALVAAAAGTGYATMSKTVTLSVDGRTDQVHTLSSTVGDVLESQGLTVGEHDVVAPGLDSAVGDGQAIAVRYGRPLDVTVDGDARRYWVTATDVDSALEQLGLRFGGADLSTSRGTAIGRSGIDLAVVTPKTVQVSVAGAKKKKATVTALRVGGALKELGVSVDDDDVVRPALGSSLEDGDKIVYTRVKVARRTATEKVSRGTRRVADAGMYDDQSKTVRAGRDGARKVVYRVVSKNGKVTKRAAVRSTVVRKPVSTVVRYGTKDRPAPTPAPASTSSSGSSPSGGSSVWDKIAACESGGNWSINTGNGYYGGLQFNLSTWQAYGGSGRPDQNSKAAQIAVAERMAAARGGYGAWPHCGSGF